VDWIFLGAAEQAAANAASSQSPTKCEEIALKADLFEWSETSRTRPDSRASGWQYRGLGKMRGGRTDVHSLGAHYADATDMTIQAS